MSQDLLDSLMKIYIIMNKEELSPVIIERIVNEFKRRETGKLNYKASFICHKSGQYAAYNKYMYLSPI